MDFVLNPIVKRKSEVISFAANIIIAPTHIVGNEHWTMVNVKIILMETRLDANVLIAVVFASKTAYATFTTVVTSRIVTGLPGRMIDVGTIKKDL